MPPSRRTFLKASGIVAASALAGTAEAAPVKPATAAQPRRRTFFDLLRPPDFVRSYETDKPIEFAKSRATSWSESGISVEMDLSRKDRARILLKAPEKPVGRIQLRWQLRVPETLRFLGDHWERGYGDLEWRGLIGDRVMPWYFLTYDGARTHGYGVATRPSAMAFWRVDDAGVSLWLDVRNGGSPVLLGERTLELCSIVTCEGREDETPWQAARSFVKQLCRTPRLAPSPIYGGNNWYYAYGENCSAESIVRDAGLLADLTGGLVNRPFQVIDDGWESAGSSGSRPWSQGNAAFPDMPGLAARLKGMGVRPGIWMRPLWTEDRALENFALRRPDAGGEREILLDPTIPEVREQIRADISRLTAWGYELIKHDFSTADLFGRWGFSMRASLTDDGWSFHDRTRTTAEIVLDLYRTIRQAAGEQTLILGCNTIGHIAAGIFEAQRIGDDTSGREWDRTRRMGVNALAFRGLQHGAFFAADADCAGITPAIPWSLNKQWMDLLAHSGTPMFVSANPSELDDGQKRFLREAWRRAADNQPVAEPLDWLNTTTPQRWRFGTQEKTYDWYGISGDTTL